MVHSVLLQGFLQDLAAIKQEQNHQLHVYNNQKYLLI